MKKLLIIMDRPKATANEKKKTQFEEKNMSYIKFRRPRAPELSFPIRFYKE